MKLIHYEKFKALDNNQRIDALYNALQPLYGGEIPEALARHDHDTQYYPRAIIDQAQQVQDLRLAQLEKGVEGDLERDRKLAALADAVTGLKAQVAAAPQSTALVPVVQPSAPVSYDPAVSDMLSRLDGLEMLASQLTDRLLALEHSVATVIARQSEMTAFLDQMAAAAAADMQAKKVA